MAARRHVGPVARGAVRNGHVLRRALARAHAHAAGEGLGPIIDVHQHTTYLGRKNEDLFAHQHNMGVALTVMLPGGTPTKKTSCRVT